MYKIIFLFSFSLEERKRKKIEDKSVDSKSPAAKCLNFNKYKLLQLKQNSA